MEGSILKVSMMLLALAVLCSAAMASDGGRLRLATTTSLHDTGLLDVVKQKFEEKYNVSLDVIAVGSGAAIKLGETGDADVLLVHDKDAELKFVASGNGLERRCLAYNYFYVVGPRDDPAGIKGLNATQAFKKILEEGRADPEKVMFVSRGDNSGTYTKEKNLWKAAGYNASKFNASDRWYISAGQGMGATLMMTNEKNAYTLSDMSTFMAYNVTYKGNFTLVPLIEGGNELLNVYTAIAVSPKKHPGVNCEMATNFINFLVSDEGQKLIADYGVEKFGHQLFFPARGNCALIGCSPAECAVPTNATCAMA
ncbi:MAG TPA: substrate-binding domain-containing protein [Methanothrix sp.]|nr:substrate-binding domain-containing protein [Methanothrix sp.]